MRKLLLALLLFPLQIYAQNCTTQPSMNTMTIAATNGIVGCTTCGTGGTITVNLTMRWTSGTGWATVYPTTFPSFTAPGNAGSYKILSGNGTAQLVLDASPSSAGVPPNPPIGTTPSRTNGGSTSNGVTAGNYVSDLGVIRNSARNYTVVWSTPGFNSDTWISYGDDEDTGGGGGIGYNWRSQDETTGVVNHSITIDRLDTHSSNPVGSYGFTVWSNCFNSNGTPNVFLSTHLPRSAVLGPNAGIASNGFQKIATTYPDTQANGYPYEDIFTIVAYDGYPSWITFIPQQDQVHPGFRVSPGGTMNFTGNFVDSIAPESPIVVGDNGIHLTVDDWVGPNMGGFFAVYGKSGSAAGAAWTGQTILVRSNGGGITINIPNTAADGRNVAACTAVAGAQAMTLDDGTPACAFPFKVSATRWLTGTHVCGTNITCGPPGTPLTPISNTPFVSEMWAIVFTPTPVRQGAVGPWISQYTGQPGIPCERQANINIEKPNPAYPNAGCRDYIVAGYTFGANGKLFTYEGNVPKPDGTGTGPWGGQLANCAWNGLRNENTFIASSQPTWFYDGAYVCHRLDMQYPRTNGNNDEYEKHIFGIQMAQAGWPRTNDAALFGDFKVSGTYTITPNPICNTIDSGENGLCSTMTIPVTGDLTALAAGFAAGTRYRICINQTTAYNWGCTVFPYSTPAQKATLAVGGNLPTESIQLQIQYTTANNDIYSFLPSTFNALVTLATDATCPTSGNCSISVPSPPSMPSAAGYDVFARVGNGTYYRQNTNGPIPIVAGTSFIFGTTTNPLQTSGFALPTGTWTSNAGNVVAVDTVNNTITTDTANGPLPSLANNANIIIVRQLAGVIADAGTNASAIVCNSCNFTWSPNPGDPAGQSNGVPKWSTVYCGVTTGDAGAPLYSLAPQRGSEISSLTANVINLATPINCASGTNFEIRKPGTMPAGVTIFNWSNSPYEVWKRYGNYMGADMILWFVSATPSLGAGSSSPCCQTGSSVSRRREVSLAFLACHRAIQVLNDLATMGSSTAMQSIPITPCTSPTAANGRWQSLFSMIDTMTNNNYGRGSNMGSFLSGLVGYVLIDWWLDPLMGVQNNPQFVYWVKRLADNLWADYELRSTYLTTCPPSWPHEWDYGLDANIIGVCSQTNNSALAFQNPDGTQTPVADYWSIYGNMIPLYAFLYWYTGNATITPPTAPPPWPSCCTSNPAPTYGAAYADMASFIFVHMASTSSFMAPGAGAKTLGEMGLWQDQALTWMRGTNGALPPTQQYPSFQVPIISESLPDGHKKNEPLFLASRSN